MKILPPCTWKWVSIYIVILLLFGYGYTVERSLRIQKEIIIKQLVIMHDAEEADNVDFINGVMSRQMNIEMELFRSKSAIQNMKRTIYQMYIELRKYKKDLPPWGGDEPLEPSDADKWT